jgi:DNA-binding HxlR family transcriptional regulator
MQKLDLIYRWMVAYKTAHNGNSPAFRDIMRACNLSSQVVWLALRELEQMGLIEIHARRARSLEIVGGRWVPPAKE